MLSSSSWVQSLSLAGFSPFQFTPFIFSSSIHPFVILLYWVQPLWELFFSSQFLPLTFSSLFLLYSSLLSPPFFVLFPPFLFLPPFFFPLPPFLLSFFLFFLDLLPLDIGTQLSVDMEFPQILASLY